MKHYLNICDINGKTIEPVDVVTFGSPCQDMSVAGKREGLKHSDQGDDETTRSGLFYEAIRIIKEMRESTNGKYPKYAVWENVPGAFSSNKGRDFHAVLEAICSVCDSTLSIPEPVEKGRTDRLSWLGAGEIVGDNYSVCWRTLDAQYWGVPQRRKRIYLVADFTGRCAGEILFKQNGLRGNLSKGDEPEEGSSADAVGGIDGGAGSLDFGRTADRIYINPKKAVTLQSCGDGMGAKTGLYCFSFDSLSSNSMKSSNPISGCREVDISKCIDTSDLNPSKNQGGVAVVQPLILKERAGCEGGGIGALWGDKAFTLSTNSDQSVIALQGNGIDRADTAGCNGCGCRKDKMYTLNTIDRHAVCHGIGNGQADQTGLHDKVGTLNCMHDQQAVCFEPGAMVRDMGNRIWEEQSPTLRAKMGDNQPSVCFARQRSDEFADCGVASCQSARQYKDATDLIIPQSKSPRKYIIRRLTPTECARLQGFPDAWGKLEPYNPEDAEFWESVRKTQAELNGKKYSPLKDIKKWYYKLHNDGAEYKMWGNGIALPCAEFVINGIAQRGAKTLGSLFDGSGGFPLAGLINGIKPLWSSEIEPYPIAVTKSRFK